MSKTIEDRKVQLKEQAVRTNELAKEFDSDDQIATIYENGDVIVYKHIKHHDSDVYINYLATTHWSTPVEVTFRTEWNDTKVKLNNSSGGVTTSTTPLQQAEAMKAIYTEIESMLQNVNVNKEGE